LLIEAKGQGGKAYLFPPEARKTASEKKIST